MKSFKIGNLIIEADAYGSQGSAFLGIRDSGKTYSATCVAEKLFDCGIPFVAFDPIGVWKNLRIPGKGKGYPVVVAGGTDGDLPLDTKNAAEIVRAAMAGGVSLVIDLFDIELSKADWKRIVTECVKVMLHENAKHGLRHIFIEEAAEFAPQRVGPDQGQVYSMIEKLARMGGNSRLGYTLINQRAEEVNKAILELCDNLFLHRQKGKNSLTSLGKWLDVGNVKESKSIINSLSTLPTGECWAWLQGMEAPELVKFPEKNSFHPDRRIMRGDKAAHVKSAVDVNSFVATMKKNLVNIELEVKKNDPVELHLQIVNLKKQLAGKGGMSATEINELMGKAFIEGKRSGFNLGIASAVRELRPRIEQMITNGMANIFEQFSKPYGIPMPNEGSGLSVKIHPNAVAIDSTIDSTILSKPYAKGDKITIVTPEDMKPVETRIDRVVSSGELTGPEKRIVYSLNFWRSIGIETPSRPQVAMVAGYSANSSAFTTPVGVLKSKGIVSIPDVGLLRLESHFGNAMSRQQARDKIFSVLDGPQTKIVNVMCGIFKNEETVSRESVASHAGYSPTSSAFTTPVGALIALGVLKKATVGFIALSDWSRELLI